MGTSLCSRLTCMDAALKSQALEVEVGIFSVGGEEIEKTVRGDMRIYSLRSEIALGQGVTPNLIELFQGEKKLHLGTSISELVARGEALQLHMVVREPCDSCRGTGRTEEADCDDHYG